MSTRKAMKDMQARVTEIEARIELVDETISSVLRTIAMIVHPSAEVQAKASRKRVSRNGTTTDNIVRRIRERGLTNQQRHVLSVYDLALTPISARNALNMAGISAKNGMTSILIKAGLVAKVGMEGNRPLYLITEAGRDALDAAPAYRYNNRVVS